jgi:putative hemolysin
MLNAFFAMAEMSLISVRRTRIKQLVEEGNARARTVLTLLERPTNFMATAQIGLTVVGFMASAFAAINIAEPVAHMLHISRLAAVVGVTILLSFFTLVFGEIAPKSLAMQHAERLALSFGGIVRLLSMVALPAVKLVSFLSDLIVRPFGVHVRFTNPILTEEELKMLVEAGEEGGVIEEGERDMIHSIFDFTDTVARQVMVPRTDMDAAPVTSTLDELLDVITNSGHSRIPIYEDNVDNIIGVVHAKDLLPVLRQDKHLFEIQAVMREAYFIPETKDVGELLAEFKRGHVQMAIVRDEYGGTAGLVTVEDLLEEIVGEIRDEYDIEEPLIDVIDVNHAIVSARMGVDDLNEQMDMDIPEDEEYETIGGFVFDQFGRQPDEGEVISWGNLDFVVHSLEGGRLHRIEVIRTDRPKEDEESNGSNGKSKKDNGYRA